VNITGPSCLSCAVNRELTFRPGDASKLRRDFNIQASGLLELRDAARAFDPSYTRTGVISLHDIVALYLGKALDKGPVRMSDWEADLSEHQMTCKFPLTFLEASFTLSQQMQQTTRTVLWKCIIEYEKSGG
jgi:hypothetical protein